MKIKFWLYRNYWLTLPIFVVVVLVLALLRFPVDVKILSAVLGGLLSFVYFVQKQRLEETKLFRYIFQECNKRYDCLNGKLNKILRVEDAKELSESERNTLDDYFNLCSEEYLYFKQGYIYPDVWKAWENGMKTVFFSPRVKEYWQSERESDSYYSLPL